VTTLPRAAVHNAPFKKTRLCRPRAAVHNAPLKKTHPRTALPGPPPGL